MKDEDFNYIRQAYAVEKMFLQNEIGYKMIEDYLNEHYGQDMLANIKGEN